MRGSSTLTVKQVAKHLGCRDSDVREVFSRGIFPEPPCNAKGYAIPADQLASIETALIRMGSIGNAPERRRSELRYWENAEFWWSKKRDESLPWWWRRLDKHETMKGFAPLWYTHGADAHRVLDYVLHVPCSEILGPDDPTFWPPIARVRFALEWLCGARCWCAISERAIKAASGYADVNTHLGELCRRGVAWQVRLPFDSKSWSVDPRAGRVFLMLKRLDPSYPACGSSPEEIQAMVTRIFTE